MSQKYFSALADVVQQTLLMICNVDARVVDTRLEKKTEAPFEVSGIIGFTGAARGGIVISMPRDIAQKITSIMLSEPEENCNEQDVSDCIGELTNIVAGNLLALVDDGQESKEARISLPSIVLGPHRVVWSRKDVPCELVLFETAVGPVAAEVNLRETVSCVAGEHHAEDFAC